jgi:hypothetical protein
MRHAIAAGMSAFILALPGALALGDLRLSLTLVWAGIAGGVASICVFYWLRRHPERTITIGLGVTVAFIAFGVTLVVFAVFSHREWSSSLVFVTLTLLFYCWYPALAGTAASVVLSKLFSSRNHVA